MITSDDKGYQAWWRFLFRTEASATQLIYEVKEKLATLDHCTSGADSGIKFGPTIWASKVRRI